MAQDLSTSITRRSLVAGLALSAAPVALAGANNAYAQAKETTKETTSEKSLYERLGGVFAIAAVVDHFSDAVDIDCAVNLLPASPMARI
jgi:hemoglobin